MMNNKLEKAVIDVSLAKRFGTRQVRIDFALGVCNAYVNWMYEASRYIEDNIAIAKQTGKGVDAIKLLQKGYALLNE